MSGEEIHGECYWCKSELCGTVIEVIGRHYHYRCFYCCKCRNPIGGKDFRMRDVQSLFSPLTIRSDFSVSIATAKLLNDVVLNAETIFETISILKPSTPTTTAYLP